jgi:hypothetical protein
MGRHGVSRMAMSGTIEKLLPAVMHKTELDRNSDPRVHGVLNEILDLS